MDTSIYHDDLKCMFKRSLALPLPGVETFFLWGPRQTGKSTLLREVYGQGRWVDLLKAEEFRRSWLARSSCARSSRRIRRSGASRS
jgi:hypothetical protein